MASTRDGPPSIDVALVRRLIATQFPRWAALAVRAVDADGWDNRSFRVGTSLSARLPSAAGYAPQVPKEVTWLPHLAAGLSLPIPRVVGVGQPGCGYPFEWTIRHWIEGSPASSAVVTDKDALAEAVAAFLVELQNVAPIGPPPGAHSAFRGGPLEHYDAETRAAIRSLGDRIDWRTALGEWERDVAASESTTLVWFHGDVSPGNLLLANGRLSAVIDFGCAGVGDPACDLAIAWTYFDEPARSIFRSRLGAGPELWARGRGWALWKALITFDNPTRRDASTRTLEALGVATA